MRAGEFGPATQWDSGPMSLPLLTGATVHMLGGDQPPYQRCCRARIHGNVAALRELERLKRILGGQRNRNVTSYSGNGEHLELFGRGQRGEEGYGVIR